MLRLLSTSALLRFQFLQQLVFSIGSEVKCLPAKSISSSLFCTLCRQNPGVDFGDVSERLALRKRLQCRSFRWYLEHVYPEMRIYNNTITYGEVRYSLTGLLKILTIFFWLHSRRLFISELWFKEDTYDMDDKNRKMSWIYELLRSILLCLFFKTIDITC